MPFHEETRWVSQECLPQQAPGRFWVTVEIIRDGVSVSRIGARTKADIIADHLDRDPLAVIKNRQDFEDLRR